jgi:predicted XRE-type DNA-binding protein
LQLNQEAEVEIQFVTEAEALQIRDANHQQRFAREKMAASRRAMLLSRAGWPQDRIATLLQVTVGRVSQMIAEAKCEERFEDLAVLIKDRHATPARFWSDLNGTRSACERADHEYPVRSGRRGSRGSMAKSPPSWSKGHGSRSRICEPG